MMKRITQKQWIIIGLCMAATALVSTVLWYVNNTMRTTDTAEQSEQERPAQETVQDTPDTTHDIAKPPITDTSTWQTYTNEEFGFSVKYPQQEGWILKIIDEENQRMHTVEIDTPRRFVVVIIKEREDPRRNSSVSIRTTDWFDITKDYYTPDENGKIPRIIPHKTITVAGRTAVTTASKDDTYIHSGTRTITFKPAPKGWGKYNVVSTGGNCEDPENETIDTILNSLQFIQ